MGIRFTITPHQLGKFEARLARHLNNASMAKVLRKAGQAACALLREASADVNYKGRYRAGWSFNIRGRKLQVTNVVAHAIYVERGRRAGARMPPIGVIRQWAVDHGMPPEAAYPIARAISERGIQGRPHLRSPMMRTRIEQLVVGELLRFRDEALRRAAGR